MQIFLDSNFRCHLTDGGGMRAIETDVFDGKCAAFVEGYRLVPDGESWTRADGAVFRGEMVAPLKDYNRILTDVAISYLDDEQAEDVAELFDNWAAGVAYAVDDRRQYDGKLYRCVQAHTSQSNWTPPAVPALWTECAKPGEIPVWKQPTGAQDAYNAGDKVWYPEKDTTVYVSTIDNNVWNPETYPAGWEVVE